MIIKKDSPLLAAMREYSAPITRDEYLAWHYLGSVPTEISPEEEAEFPERFQLSTLLDTPPASEKTQ